MSALPEKQKKHKIMADVKVDDDFNGRNERPSQPVSAESTERDAVLIPICFGTFLDRFGLQMSVSQEKIF